MAVDLPNELEAFQRFVDQAVKSGAVTTVDELWTKYREYRDELAKLRAELDEAILQADRGEARPLDIEALNEHVRRRLAQNGVTD